VDEPEWMAHLVNADTAYVLFSGGKDSCAALAYTKELLQDQQTRPRLVALHVDTTAGLPAVEGFAEEFCAFLGVPLEVIRPEEDYFTLVKRWGVPRPRARWCCFHLKIEPIRVYLESQQDYVVLDGMRRQESRKRSGYPATYDHPHFGLVVHPIIDWTSEEIEDFITSRDLPVNPAYQLGFSSWECWCGVFKRKCEFERLLEVDREFFMRLVELEDALRSGYAYAYFDGKPFYLRGLLEDDGQSRR
jgi:3'-phosphoadenosine 5'-phosphosulfate sulfotransferase (PAPS reductase)/FAD synthetase